MTKRDTAPSADTSWRKARYGRNRFQCFSHNCSPDERYISRPRPEYRYRLKELPACQ